MDEVEIARLTFPVQDGLPVPGPQLHGLPSGFMWSSQQAYEKVPFSQMGGPG